MSRTFAPTLPRAVLGIGEAIRALPYAAYTLVVAIVLVCGAMIADMRSPGASGPQVPDSTPAQQDVLKDADAVMPAPAAVARATARPRARCASCGVVESIRALEPVGNLPEYEFTVRLRDGTARVSRTIGRGTWRVGDGIMLMGGAGPSGQ
jgi:hypothetical protein